MFHDPAREAAMAAHIQQLADTLAQIPELTLAACDALIKLARIGTTVNPYQTHGRWVIEIRKPADAPDLECRWTPRAWSAFVAGHHEAEDTANLCQCTPCQRRRMAEAWARYRAQHDGGGQD